MQTNLSESMVEFLQDNLQYVGINQNGEAVFSRDFENGFQNLGGDIEILKNCVEHEIAPEVQDHIHLNEEAIILLYDGDTD